MSPLLQLGTTSTGMAGFVEGLTDSTTGISAGALWDQITPAVPFIVAIFIFAFGYGFVRRLVKRGSKGKVGA